MKNFEFYVIGLRDNNPEPFAFYSEQHNCFLSKFSKNVSIYSSESLAKKAKAAINRNIEAHNLEDTEQVEVYKISSTINL